jgi:hypothetical protein
LNIENKGMDWISLNFKWGYLKLFCV